MDLKGPSHIYIYIYLACLLRAKPVPMDRSGHCPEPSAAGVCLVGTSEYSDFVAQTSWENLGPR